jgi:hypothetical protein
MQEQIDLGPRIPGSQASLDFEIWVHEEVDSSIWNVTTQRYVYRDANLRNFWITDASSSEFPEYIIGAHYDSRAIADKEYRSSSYTYEEQLEHPVPGANDGASGIAGQLEMMRHIPAELRSKIGFVMFDAEDQGSGGMKDTTGLSWGWIIGSKHFVEQMSPQEISNTKAFVLFDMIADDDFSLPYEPNSDNDLIDQIWDEADAMGYGSIFVDSPGTPLTDDHIPFRNAGIPSIDIIDFTYPEHHTTLDDMDHISEESAAIVVDVTLAWFTKTSTYTANSSSTIQSSETITGTTTGPTDGTSTNDDTSVSTIALFISVIGLIVIWQKLRTKFHYK